MIRIFKTAQGWMADFEDSRQCEEIRSLFSSTILPLPWTAQAEAHVVMDDLQRRNPREVVVLERRQS